ncbi:MAG TPA: aminomethyl-transferring glycine dehydrogenase subunit GcvPB [Candidatus Acidoferrales bacterium]|nr:aminomethyl-transferring glycine dehydrogenase subunit GcvPB [Candidatus Acidoferrales bacterium]
MPEKLIFELSHKGRKGYTLSKRDVPFNLDVPKIYLRSNFADLPEVSENEVVRHFVRLSTLNYHIDKGFYPLGSCTMKYNPKVNEKTSSMPGNADIHPLEPEEAVQGALELMYNLSGMLREIAGMSAVSLQPAAGAQGELTGIMLIRKYHESKGEVRSKILVPDSAHGTNPASVAISGYKAVSIKSNRDGRVDLEDLKKNLDDEVAGMMLTNPNTLGIFESDILTISKMVHYVGGLMYMDGANLNAIVGLVRPGDMGFDVVHINLHKTFSTPHGGGGPGSGPVAVNDKLKDFLPVPLIEKHGEKFSLNFNKPDSIGKIHSFFGNFGMLVRAYTYILSHGPDGLRNNSINAVINANYLLSKLCNSFVLPFNARPMHEFVLSTDTQKARGVRTLDVAKRLLDYGYHAPTIYFPLIVHEALMIEPTETETKETLDSFADALLMIDQESRISPETLRDAPMTTPVRRLDDAYAARNVNVCFKE